MNGRNFKIKSPNATGWRGEFPDGVTNKNFRDLAAELEHQIRDLDRQTHRRAFQKDHR
jgi:hypothetical protein